MKDTEQGMKDTRQGWQDGAPSHRPPNSMKPRPEPNEPLYPPNPMKPRPEPNEPLYPPNSMMPRPEPNEPLYPPNSMMPRPEPNEPLYPHNSMKPRPEQSKPHHSKHPMYRAVAASAGAMPPPAAEVVEMISKQEQWLRELEAGLRELEQGLADLAQGERELREGQAEYEKGAAERDYWQQQVRNARAVPIAATAADGQRDDIIPISEENRTAQSDVSIPSTGTGTGYLTVNVSTARGALPIEGAFVIVTRRDNGGEMLYATAVTDSSGFTPLIALSAGTAPEQLPNYAAPFEKYDVSVYASGNQPVERISAQIFADIISTLPVQMIPTSR